MVVLRYVVKKTIIKHAKEAKEIHLKKAIHCY